MSEPEPLQERMERGGLGPSIGGDRAAQLVSCMEEISRCDGETPDELAVINAFRGWMKAGAPSPLDPRLFEARPLARAAIQALAVVALADGRLSGEELRLLHMWGAELALSQGEVKELIQEAAHELISSLADLPDQPPARRTIERALGIE